MSNKFSRAQDSNNQPANNATPPKRPTGAAPSVPSSESSLGAVQQAHTSAIASVTASKGTGSTLAIRETQAFAEGYVQTKQKLAPVLAETMQRATDEMHAAITSAAPSAEGASNDEAFLLEFKQGLNSLFTPT